MMHLTPAFLCLALILVSGAMACLGSQAGQFAPIAFFLGNSNLRSSNLVDPAIISLSVKQDTLELQLMSDGGKYHGTFWIDLAARKVVRSSIDSTVAGGRAGIRSESDK